MAKTDLRPQSIKFIGPDGEELTSLPDAACDAIATMLADYIIAKRRRSENITPPAAVGLAGNARHY